MDEFVFAPQPQPWLTIKNSQKKFPIHRVYCIGRNYADHAIEMGHDPAKEPPFFFQKNPQNLNESASFPYPPLSHDVHHEIELMVAMKAGGQRLSYDQAQASIFGYGICLDMTRRDLQSEAKKLGRPWEIAKAFEHSAPCSPLTEVTNVNSMASGEISLTINGEIRQKGNLNQMIWKIPELIISLSQYFTLYAGDIILTGTPAGVGPVKRGDHIIAKISGLDDLVIDVV